jgi:hypothetical protein
MSTISYRLVDKFGISANNVNLNTKYDICICNPPINKKNGVNFNGYISGDSNIWKKCLFESLTVKSRDMTVCCLPISCLYNMDKLCNDNYISNIKLFNSTCSFVSSKNNIHGFSKTTYTFNSNILNKILDINDSYKVIQQKISKKSNETKSCIHFENGYYTIKPSTCYITSNVKKLVSTYNTFNNGNIYKNSFYADLDGLNISSSVKMNYIDMSDYSDNDIISLKNFMNSSIVRYLGIFLNGRQSNHKMLSILKPIKTDHILSSDEDFFNYYKLTNSEVSDIINYEF